MTLERAIDITAHAFAIRKSRHHPYLVRNIDGLWVLRDKGPKKEPRKSEVFVADLSPEDIVARVSRNDLGWHFLCACHGPESDEATFKNEVKKLGYRAAATEWIFTHDLAEIPTIESDPAVVHYETQEEIDKIGDNRWKPIKVENGRFYGLADPLIFGMVESMRMGDDAYVADLYVRKERRGKGYGSALMSALLKGDKASGVRESVLVASTDGRKLYPKLGYKEIGVMHVFTPKQRCASKTWDD
ncbi:MAG: GNAT family N-acetyltransferase [Chthonomonas sp.]|nr:GNAT family N-acetyltransferase [Chthonomonas sp.]